MKLRALTIAGLLALGFSQIQCAFEPEDEEPGLQAENERPTVWITAGAVDSTDVDYRVRFRWDGQDPDGMVTGFEWAVDDTTLEEAWHWTPEQAGFFRFRATTGPEDPADSLFHDWHRFFIRAVDDDSARSSIESRYFNTVTIAPRSWFDFPPDRDCMEFCWEGEDLDASNPEKLPEFFEYKLVRTNFGEDPVQALLHAENVFLDTLQTGDKRAWIRVTPDVTCGTLPRPLPSLYALGIRSIDEAGAVELLQRGSNYYVYEVTGPLCTIDVTLHENALGSFTFPDNGPVWNVEVPAETPIRFQWSGEPCPYGDCMCCSRPFLVNYGLDIPAPGDEDLDDPDGIGGWIGWHESDGLQEPYVFPGRDDGKIHNFYLRMRDATGEPETERFCWVQMRVVYFPLNRGILIVDDATPPRAFGGTDAEHDAFRDRVFSCIGEYLEPGEEIAYVNMYGDDERSSNPRNIPLSLIAGYRLVIWNSYFFGRIESGLTRNEYRRRILSSYMGAGGRLYLFGSKPIASLANDNYGDYVGDGLCPDPLGGDRPAWDETSFIWDFLRCRSCVRGPDDLKVDGWVGARGVHPMYPDLAIDPDVWDPWRPDTQGDPMGGIKNFQVYMAPEGQPPAPDPDLDTIYVARTFNWGGQSELDGEPCALRYEPPGQKGRGRVVLQMFDFLYVDEEAAREAACKAVGWLMTGRDE